MKPDERCVLVFLKSPDPGVVKSRLSPEIAEEVVAPLYKAFCHDLLATLRKGSYAFKIFFHPPEAGEKISSWLGKDFACEPQRGKDLGERMKNAFLQTFSEGFLRVVLIGSDLPDLTNEVLHKAFELESHDAVLGPALDGGYYLIGFKNNTFLPEIFEGIPWSTDTVFAKTMEILGKKNYRVRTLQGWRDIDTIEDIKSLVLRNRTTDFATSRTMIFILDNMKKLFE